jgi:predicted Zn-dependent peptidase
VGAVAKLVPRWLLPGALALVGVPAGAVDRTVERWALDRGTDVVLVRDHRVPVVRVTIELPVGLWSPWAWTNHAGEAFDIQVHDRGGSLRERADELSVDLSIGMGDHAAKIEAECLREDLPAVLDLVRDVIENRDFDVDKLKRWNRNDRLEWDGAQKQPAFRLAQAAARLLYAEDDPRRRDYEKPRPRITDVRSLVAARDVVMRVPGRVIGFAGDLARADAERLAAGLLPEASDVPPPGIEPVLLPMTSPEDLPSEHRETMARIEQAFFAYGRHSLTYDSPQYPAFLVADHVVGGHFFSRMYAALRHEDGQTYGATTIGQGGVHAEGYALLTFTRADNAAVTEDKLREIVRVLHESGVTEDERAAAIDHLRGRRAFDRQAPTQILERHLWERRHGLPDGFLDDLVERAARVPLEDINAFVRDFYDPAHFHLLTLAPH